MKHQLIYVLALVFVLTPLALAAQDTANTVTSTEPLWAVETAADLMSPVDAVGFGENDFMTETAGLFCPPKGATQNGNLCMPEDHGQSTPMCDVCEPGVENICCDCICYCLASF